MLIQREIISKIEKWLPEREIIVLIGARQVGKTSILKLLKEHLQKEITFYFDLEDSFDLQICAEPNNFINNILSKGAKEDRTNYCFIDEIQYHPEPTKFLKILHDHHPYVKLIVTGSSSLSIKSKFKDALTGRKQVFPIYPLNFLEFLRFKKSDFESVKKSLNLFNILSDFELYKKYAAVTLEILPLWEEFIVMGGYPLPSLTREQELKHARLREIFNSYIQRDIKDWARITDVLTFSKVVLCTGQKLIYFKN